MSALRDSLRGIEIHIVEMCVRLHLHGVSEVLHNIICRVDSHHVGYLILAEIGGAGRYWYLVDSTSHPQEHHAEDADKKRGIIQPVVIFLYHNDIRLNPFHIPPAKQHGEARP